MAKKNLHILFPEKFFNSYIQFINENFEAEHHLFLYLKTKGDEPDYPNVRKLRFYRIPILFHFELYQLMKNHDKVFLHSLSKEKVLSFLFLFRKFAKKCYWLLWGGDMYYRLSQNSLRPKRNLSTFIFKKVVQKLGFVLSNINGDVAIARKAFGFKGLQQECMLYPSNIYNKPAFSIGSSTGLTILLGNSSHISNKHEEILIKVSKLNNPNIKVYCPLSYGDHKHAKKVIQLGKQLLGDRFIPLTSFIPLSDYNKILSEVNIAIFNHWRQQGVGNIVTLLGMGKTVYLRKTVTTWDMLTERGIYLKEIDDLSTLGTITGEQSRSNSKIVENYFSRETLIQQYQNIF